VARIERDEEAGLADLGLRLAETKQLTAALQAEIVPAQVAVVGERRRCWPSCGHRLASKGHYPVTFRSLFGDVPVRVQRLVVCPCQGPVGAKSCVADNGTGLAASNMPGLGFTGMRERVEGLGGELAVGADREGKGLIVTARLPCAVAKEAA
jgi:hypothetical protein